MISAALTNLNPPSAAANCWSEPVTSRSVDDQALRISTDFRAWALSPVIAHIKAF